MHSVRAIALLACALAHAEGQPVGLADRLADQLADRMLHGTGPLSSERLDRTALTKIRPGQNVQSAALHTRGVVGQPAHTCSVDEKAFINTLHGGHGNDAWPKWVADCGNENLN